MKNILIILILILTAACDDDSPSEEQLSDFYRVFKFDKEYGAACGTTVHVDLYEIPVLYKEDGKELLTSFSFDYGESYTYDFKKAVYCLAEYSFDGGLHRQWWMDINANSSTREWFLNCH